MCKPIALVLANFPPLAILVCFFCVGAIPGSAQYETKNVTAVRTAETPKIDGVLNEACWSTAIPAKDFIIDRPTPGVAMPYQTEVRVVYDDIAMYFAFYNFDPHPDSIMQQLSGRDQDGNSDYCGITLSCYRDGVNGFTFATSPQGEQWDARENTNSGEDVSWNAIWDVRTSIQADGWIAEFVIPFAAIRFPEKESQVWNINFVREIRRSRQHSFWRGVNPEVNGYLTQMGTIDGIEGVQAPARIFLNPYASMYYLRNENYDGTLSSGFNYNGGLDLKLGLGPAFTLDATVIPDFGQTLSDQLILNLTAFDIQFNDNRQFFIEGTDLFEKTDIFYSRRIGFDLPIGYFDVYGKMKSTEEIVSNPSQDQVINAMKITGRDENGLGLGVFNGITAGSEATVRDFETGITRNIRTSSLTNYNAIVIDQNLPNNSYINIMNTNVLRQGEDYDANVTAYAMELRNKANRFSLYGSGAVSQKFGEQFRAYEQEEDRGFRNTVVLSEIDGQWTWEAGSYLESKYYDPNDLGFLQAPNSAGYWAEMNYRIFKPFGKFNNMWSSLAANYNNLYAPYTFTDCNVSGEVGLNTRKFFTFNVSFEVAPFRGYDYFEPRIEGRVFRTYRYEMIGGWISTDYRKRVAIDASTFYTHYENNGRYRLNWRIAPRFRVNDKLFITYVYSHQNHFNDLGFAYAYVGENDDQPLFGRRDVISHTNVLSFNYAFNPYMTINTRIRHYWGYSDFNRFFELMADGYLTETDDESANLNFNTFTIDMIYKWIFVPGSELTVVWKRAITHQNNFIQSSLIEDIDFTLQQPQNNSFSLRVSYFLDYPKMARKLKAKSERNT